VAGMTVAHELASRPGFEVVVYELRPIPGGKARSMAARPGTDGRLPLPGEHGFRFFPGFYKHLPDTMRRVPYGRNANGVRDNLLTATEIQIAQEGGRNELVTPAALPTSISDWRQLFEFVVGYSTEVDIPHAEGAFFVKLLSDLVSSCEERRFEEYEHLSWWEFSGAGERSEKYQKFLADGLTRSLVAARAREMSARTGGYILIQLLQDLAQPWGQADRVLRGPTSDVWLDPWLAELRSLGVDFRMSHRVERLESERNRVTRIAGHTVRWTDEGAQPVEPFDAAADHFVAAVPVEVMQDQIAMEPLKEASSSLQRLSRLVYRWMNGIMFYLDDDMPLVHGHTLYIDSAWALTSISQRQFWPSVEFSGLGDGRTGGILSVDVSDWDTPGRYIVDRPARHCTKEEVASEVWAQLKAALNDGEELLSDANRLDWFLDPSIVYPNPTQATNLEPLMINDKGSWDYRPEAVLPDVENLSLASDYVRTHTDLATMEGANEAARRAVNAILDATGHDAGDRCEVWPLREPGGLFALARAADRVVFELFGPRRPPPSPVRLEDGALEASRMRAAFGSFVGR
jgi:uncharacterized protein with NAD-binding domain and iron-sulfur cluster